VAAVVKIERPAGAQGWASRYPPLLSVLIALLLALVVLPSSLNLPQANPATTLELAPVPPTDDDPPTPPQGNFDSLSLAGSSGLTSGGALGGTGEGAGPQEDDDAPPPPQTDPAGSGKTPRTKRCVGNPPRQTEDPLSPPCSASFEGDNFGATYQGVSGEEIRLLFYTDGSINDTRSSRSSEVSPSNKLVDLGAPPEDDEHFVARILRAYQTYFNDRFQLYGRTAHFYVYFGTANATVETRRADASEAFALVKPFATVSYAQFGGGGDSYLESMAKRGVLNFGTFASRDEAFFNKYPKLIWGYLPSLQQQADQFGSYLCSKVVNQPVVDSGNPGQNGQPRKLGLLYTTDPGYEALRRFKDAIIQKVEACGGKFEQTRTYPRAGYTIDNSQLPDYAIANMQAMQQAGITTIIWPGGVETKQSQAADQIHYYPEWILAGDYQIELATNAITQAQPVWDHAWVVTNVVKTGAIADEPCYQAYREADPEANPTDITTACEYYTDLFQLFTGLQVAGPRLGPTSVDKGLHAIPAIESKDPTIPACYYLPGDYTCVKDAMTETWDPSGRETSWSTPGCYRMLEGGLRHTSGKWPAGNINAGFAGTEECNRYDGSFQFDPNPPSAPGL
jgi:hypothetical protein